MTTTTTDIVASLRDDMTRAAAGARKNTYDILDTFCNRLEMRLTFESQETQQKIQWIVDPILDQMAEERGTES